MNQDKGYPRRGRGRGRSIRNVRKQRRIHSKTIKCWKCWSWICSRSTIPQRSSAQYESPTLSPRFGDGSIGSPHNTKQPRTEIEIHDELDRLMKVALTDCCCDRSAGRIATLSPWCDLVVKEIKKPLCRVVGRLVRSGILV
jgi:hypothetical protein